ncbi:MAG: hypothetical protein M1358_12170 [Chloroflexi bacterium]|nr:hypothetical protein [Chloroflexota bacterium]
MLRSVARTIANAVSGHLRYALSVSVVLAVLAVVGEQHQPSMAATGDVLRTITVNPPVPACSQTVDGLSYVGLTVGIALDGSELLLACTRSNVLIRVNPADGSVLGQITVPAILSWPENKEEGIGALSWDAKNNQLWIGTVSGSVYTAVLDKAAGTAAATLRFTPAEIKGHGFAPLLDGLDIDRDDGTLWLSPDLSDVVFHYNQTGTLLGSFSVLNRNFGDNSGVVVADANALYLLNASQGQVFCARKDGSILNPIAFVENATFEDAELDTVTFAPKTALWIRDTRPGNESIVRAVEVDAVKCALEGPTATPSPPGPTPTPSSTPVPPGPVTAVDAKMEIVFPHDPGGNLRPVSQATLANIGAFLFYPNTLIPVPCAFNNAVGLSRSANSDPSQFVGLGTPKLIQQGGQNITMWQWNDVDVSGAVDPLNKYYFTLGVDKVATNTNVWSHGEDARTIFPQQDVPTGLGPLGTEADARIEIVFPHDAQGNPKPVVEASLVNIGADLFAVGTLQSAPLDANYTVRLFRSLNNDPQREVGVGQKAIVSTGGVSHPRWLFNDIDVSASQNPLNKYYFRISVDGLGTHSNVWSHGADARTIFPNIDTPSQSCQ